MVHRTILAIWVTTHTPFKYNTTVRTTAHKDYNHKGGLQINTLIYLTDGVTLYTKHLPPYIRTRQIPVWSTYTYGDHNLRGTETLNQRVWLGQPSQAYKVTTAIGREGGKKTWRPQLQKVAGLAATNQLTIREELYHTVYQLRGCSGAGPIFIALRRVNLRLGQPQKSPGNLSPGDLNFLAL